jgi:hypothetical protein
MGKRGLSKTLFFSYIALFNSILMLLLTLIGLIFSIDILIFIGAIFGAITIGSSSLMIAFLVYETLEL